mgnify:CR=1 FL=1
MTTNNDQFVRVPMWILSISKVNGVKFSDTSKTLYCYLKGFDKAYPSYSTIGKVFGISARGAEERVKKLLEMGLIRKDNRPGTSSLFEVLDIPGHEAPEQVPEVKEHLSFDDDTDEELPEEEAPAPEKVKPKQVPTKKPAIISTKEIKIEPVNLNFLDGYRHEWENPDKNLPVSQHPKIRWLLINGYLDTDKNPKLKTIYEEIKHLC